MALLFLSATIISGNPPYDEELTRTSNATGLLKVANCFILTSTTSKCELFPQCTREIKEILFCSSSAHPSSNPALDFWPARVTIWPVSVSILSTKLKISIKNTTIVLDFGSPANEGISSIRNVQNTVASFCQASCTSTYEPPIAWMQRTLGWNAKKSQRPSLQSGTNIADVDFVTIGLHMWRIGQNRVKTVYMH